MSLWDNVKKFAQPYDDEEYDDYDEELDDFEEPAQEPAPRTRRPSPFASTASDSLSMSWYFNDELPQLMTKIFICFSSIITSLLQ